MYAWLLLGFEVTPHVLPHTCTAFCEVSQFRASQHSHRRRQDSGIVVHNLITRHLKIGMQVCLALSNCPQQIFFFVIVFAPCWNAQNKSALVRRSQRAIICLQPIKIGKDIEL